MRVDTNKKARPWDIFNKNIEKVMPEQQLVRLDICKSCPELIQLTKQCKKCGCFMEAKTKLPHASCPLGKWEKVDVSITKEIEE
jgi:hypothetical protein